MVYALCINEEKLTRKTADVWISQAVVRVKWAVFRFVVEWFCSAVATTNQKMEKI